MNSEKRKAYMKEYNKMYAKKYKAKRKAYMAKYHKDNFDKLGPIYRENSKKYHYDTKEGVTTVYLLKDNYVGVTDNTWDRLGTHKSQRNYKGLMCVLYQTEDRSEALELEALLHDMGYKGRNQFYDRAK